MTSISSVGLSTAHISNGCLQDVHWYAGLFGYFPTYSLGALTAAQLASQLRTDITNLDTQIENGNFEDSIMKNFINKITPTINCDKTIPITPTLK